MGAVWLAQHAMLGRRAAVKILHKDYSARSEMVSRFFNEARAATAISDPGIVQIFDFGHHTDGTAYIVMELLEGEALDKRIRSRGPMPIDSALRIIRQVATSLSAAHARGIVHRDLKPENIFLVRDAEVAGGERAKILDFGIAKLQGDRQGWRTETSQVMGTPLYMSPEQCRGAGMVDHRTDIYSLGCVLFVLVTGRPPFLAEGSGDLIAMHLREAPPKASTYNVRVTHEIDQLIDRCLAKDPNQRFSSGTDFASAITNLLSTQSSIPPVHTPVPNPLPGVAKNATTLSSSSGMIAMQARKPAPTRAGSRGLRFVGLAATLVAAAVVGFIVVSSGKDDETKTAANDTKTRAVVDAAVIVQTPPGPKPVEPAPPAVTPEDPKRADTIRRIRNVALGFVRWAETHKETPCPTAKDLALYIGGTSKFQDGWGHPLTLTCTGQPEQQRIGLVSAGPDGIANTRDDVQSWLLGDDVTEVLVGARWVAKVKPKPTPKGTTTPKRPGAPVLPRGPDDDIPTEAH